MIKCCLDSDFKVSNDLKKLKFVAVPRNHYFGQKLNQDYDEEKKAFLETCNSTTLNRKCWKILCV